MSRRTTRSMTSSTTHPSAPAASPMSPTSPPDLADPAGFERDLRRTVRGEVAFDAGTRALYTTDAFNYRSAPAAVVIPLDTDDVIAATAVCHARAVPLVPRGGGTSVAGNALGGGLLLDMSRHLTRIGPVDADARTVRVEPGAVLGSGPDERLMSRAGIGGERPASGCCGLAGNFGSSADITTSRRRAASRPCCRPSGRRARTPWSSPTAIRAAPRSSRSHHEGPSTWPRG